ncbi:MarR family transcriptional regulator [Paenibacillus thiaminolyticus]|uniref:MarR family winged helix-turn-helix transcriptional regulator n=1 Tax=Paenibacillus thiaminolyticus TaxID=49283 RepID=UPI00232E8C55|nr:MarR family transcriptional regulator [Paenibacillus thiaminolyticus]WCF07610.1 MarR family transcriptional regulator [Paenibacillus thiaminolyticus]
MTTSHPLPPDERLKLDNQLCFAIYAASRELTKLYRPLLEGLELTYPQYLALLALWEHDGMTVKELGHRLYLDSGTLTPMLKRMEQQGLIRRTRAAEDERKVILSLTGKGHSLKKEAACIPAQLAELADSARLDPACLLGDIRTLLDHLSQLPPQPGE